MLTWIWIRGLSLKRRFSKKKLKSSAELKKLVTRLDINLKVLFLKVRCVYGTSRRFLAAGWLVFSWLLSGEARFSRRKQKQKVRSIFAAFIDPQSKLEGERAAARRASEFCVEV